MVRQALLCSYNELHPIKTKKIKLYTNIPIVPSFRDYFFLGAKMAHYFEVHNHLILVILATWHPYIWGFENSEIIYIFA
jgi:hypothetical protein